MNDAELCKRMGEAGRRHVGERFDYRVVARKFIDIVTQKLEVL
jgi:starch synthase